MDASIRHIRRSPSPPSAAAPARSKIGNAQEKRVSARSIRRVRTATVPSAAMTAATAG